MQPTLVPLSKFLRLCKAVHGQHDGKNALLAALQLIQLIAKLVELNQMHCRICSATYVNCLSNISVPSVALCVDGASTVSETTIGLPTVYELLQSA